MKQRFWIIPILLIVCLPVLAYGQIKATSGPRFYSEFKPIVGGWSEYQIKSTGGPTMKIKVAIVGKEGDAYWYETVMEEGHQGPVITKMLVSGNPEDQKNIKRMIVKEGNNPPMEIPIEMMPSSQKAEEAKGKIVDKGSETITVPAGTFKTRHLQYQDPEGTVETWIFKDVSPYGLVKSQSKGTEMVLVAYGTGAKTQITETPQRFEMPKIPQLPDLPLGRPKKR